MDIDFGDVSIAMRNMLRGMGRQKFNAGTSAAMLFLNATDPNTIKLVRKVMIEWGYRLQRAGHQAARHFGLVQDQWLCLTYIGAVLLLLAYRPQWTRRLAVVGLAGRMALTNYMIQAAVLDALASGYGFGLRIRPLLYLPAALALFGLEAAASSAWLSRYRYGPLEWVWRSFTYARLQPLVRSPACVPGISTSASA